MYFFFLGTYPVDYDTYVERRSDIAIIDNKLEGLEYKSFKDVVDDMRLMFDNAILYNEKFADKSQVSKHVYETALEMKPELEKQIDNIRKHAVERKGRIDVEALYKKNLKRDAKLEKQQKVKDEEDRKEEQQLQKRAQLMEKVRKLETNRVADANSQVGREMLREQAERIEGIKVKLRQDMKEQKMKAERERQQQIQNDADAMARERRAAVAPERQPRLKKVNEDIFMLHDEEAEIEAREKEQQEKEQKERKIRDEVYSAWRQERRELEYRVEGANTNFLDWCRSRREKESYDGPTGQVRHDGSAEDMDVVDGAGGWKPVKLFARGGAKKKRLLEAVPGM